MKIRSKRPLPKNWKSIRSRLFHERNFLCELCLKENKITPLTPHGDGAVLDHIEPRASKKWIGVSDDLMNADSNLQILCSDCAKKKDKIDRQNIHDRKKGSCVHGVPFVLGDCRQCEKNGNISTETWGRIDDISLRLYFRVDLYTPVVESPRISF